MYARVARFEGGEPAAIDEQVAEMKAQLAAGRSGELPAGAPEQARTLMETVSRVVQLVDRETRTSVGLVFCKTESDMQRAHEALDQMSPGPGAGGRTSVDIFEVVVDESFD